MLRFSSPFQNVCFILLKPCLRFKSLTVFTSVFVFYFFFFTINVSAQTEANAPDTIDALVAQSVGQKYAAILGIAEDSLEFLPLYEVLEIWPEFIKSKPAINEENIAGVFAQFIYYLTFSTKIPSEVTLIYKDQKTYLFKNTNYLRGGDLLFFGSEDKSPDRLAIYLQNNILVCPQSDGKLKFVNLDQIQQKYSLKAAKIDRDV